MAAAIAAPASGKGGQNLDAALILAHGNLNVWADGGGGGGVGGTAGGGGGQTNLKVFILYIK